MMKKRILVVDDEQNMLKLAKIMLDRMGYEPLLADNAEEALRQLGQKRIDMVLTDLKMPGGLSGIDLLGEMRRRGMRTPVVIMTAFGTIKNAVEAMKQGASDFILKPFDVDSIEMAIARVFEMETVKRENVFLREELRQQREVQDIVGRGERMGEIHSMIDRVAPTDAAVLIYGETGTGKELLARSIHEKSSRRERLFVAVNCAAIPATLLESELFGHTKGAFTGAEAERTGRFEKADGGSIFFDEIGDMEPVLQAKILRVLQEKEFEKVGSPETISVNVRVIAATNRDLRKMIREGAFREDLYYRLNVVGIAIPPLRERQEDIPLLAEHFTAKYSREWGKEVAFPGDPLVLAALRAYPWPGNVREMENVIERAVALNSTGRIGPDDLPAEIVHGSTESPCLTGAPEKTAPADMEGAVSSLERGMIARALREAQGVKARAAKLLGISERNLWYKLKKYEISG
ncbi:MAG: sigma-54 dependent transcriptional regulator [Candidatus Aureabacteria bacterium]|nr:sigma-54 dependent transcriptional regulator [Candidatus Auribacterota bacterium]